MERLYIWGEHIPGNSRRRKEEVMEIRRGKGNVTLDTLRWIMTVRKKRYQDRKKVIDTYTHRWVRGADPDYRDTFEDQPYLIPFIAAESRQAVIVVPGGGYCVKSMEDEGTKVAKRLQEQGITAFVLWYRTNPYYQPIPLMDMQRAVRFVRFHAAEYGYDADQIGAIGFSAGGAQVGLFMNIYRGSGNPFSDYKEDGIDRMDDTLDHMALVYPALSYRENIPMMFASFPAREVRDAKRRRELMEAYDAVQHMSCAGIPHFISYGTKDTMVSLTQLGEYRDILKDTNTSFEEVPVDGAGHGYGASVGQACGFWLDKYIHWLKKLEK